MSKCREGTPSEILANLRKQALSRVRDEYETVALMNRVDLEQFNRSRDESQRFHSREDFLRLWWNRAGAVADFAVALGLITPTEAGEILAEFCRAHPELADQPRPPTQ